MLVLTWPDLSDVLGGQGQTCRLVRSPHQLSDSCFPDKECDKQCGVVQEMVCSVRQKKKCTVVHERKCQTLQEKECNTVSQRKCQTVTDRECYSGQYVNRHTK